MLFRIKREEFIQIVRSKTEWICTSPNEQCRPTDLVVTNSNAEGDCGLIINPNAVQAQIESNIIQGTSRTLKEEVAFDASNVTSVDWRGYPILTYPEIPQVNITLINRPDQPAGGVGEPATCPVAAAISNAIFDATGVRLRRVPLTPERVKAALARA